jgi:hypothetical protein
VPQAQQEQQPPPKLRQQPQSQPRALFRPFGVVAGATFSAFTFADDVIEDPHPLAGLPCPPRAAAPPPGMPLVQVQPERSGFG